FNPTGAGSLIFAKDGSLTDRALVNPDKNNISPRVGGVYKLSEQSIIRGGYGVFYNQFDRIGSEDQLALNPPCLLNIDVQSASGSLTPVLQMQNGFTTGFLDPSNINLTRIMVRSADPDSPRTMVQQFGGGFERQLGRTFVASVDIVGSQTRHL